MHGVDFTDGFASHGVDLQPFDYIAGERDQIQIRYRLSPGAPTLEMWMRCADGAGFAWSLDDPPSGDWHELRIPLRDFAMIEGDGVLAGRHIVWWHVTTRAAPGRRLAIENLAVQAGEEDGAP
ncbi:MAG: hypothetical protein PF961_01820 [Planctomycetota bacterium]|nr:hypothetical protein [Planctomycetota bacterium]